VARTDFQPQSNSPRLWLARLCKWLKRGWPEIPGARRNPSDRDDEQRVRIALAEREAFWTELLRTVPDTLYVQDLVGGQLLYSNQNLASRLGYSEAERDADGNRFWLSISHPDEEEYIRRLLNLRVGMGEGYVQRSQLRWRHRDGSWRWFAITEQAMARDEFGRVTRLVGIAREVTEQIEANQSVQASERRYRALAESLNDIIFATNSELAIDYISPSVQTVLGADRQQENQLGFILNRIRQQGSWEGEFWLKRKDGETYPGWVGITGVRDQQGALTSYVCFFSDMSERKASEQRIHRLAYYDGLTQLPNRTLFQDRLYNSLQQAARHGDWVVLLFLDLDRFKPINDSLGHAAGDRMLKDVAARLAACVDEDDTVARMGGDEFTFLLATCADRDDALKRAIHAAECILQSLKMPFSLSGREFFVTASIGIALSPQDGDDLSQLMKNADTAMYHAKARGKNNFQFYQADMNARALERLELESDLRHALEQRQFVLHYQPQFLADGLTLAGVETLLRWQHPVRGLVPPGDFIPALEELGLIADVGDWILDEACRQIATWQAAGRSVPRVSVNLSARQFGDGALEQRIARTLQASGISPSCLELELTESILMQEVGEAMRMLESLKRLGLSIAVDDFGTGYSSLNYLKRFPIDVLKIDRSFVDGLPAGEQDAQITRVIIAMAHSLGMTVIAEGVETQAQLDFLREHGCDEVQGFLLGRPMPPDEVVASFERC